MARQLLFGLLAVAALLVAGCGEIAEPEGFAAVTSTTEPDESDADAATGDEADATRSQSASTPTTFSFPIRDPDYVPELLLVTERAVLLADNETIRPLEGVLAGLEAIQVFDDFLGGLVVQGQPIETVVVETGGETGIGSRELGDVTWYETGVSEPIVIDETGAQLLDVGYVEGAASAVVLVDGERIERIRIVDLERTPLLSLTDGEELLDLSAAAGVHAVAVANEACGELRFYDTVGAAIDLGGPGSPACPVPRRPAFGAVALAPVGGAVVYTEIRYRDDGLEVATDLVARELPADAEYFRTRIGNEGDQILAVSFDGERVAYLRQSDGEVAVHILDLITGRDAEIDLTGITPVGAVSFTRLEIADSGP